MIYYVTWATRKQFMEGQALGRLYAPYLIQQGLSREDGDLLNGIRKIRFVDLPKEGSVEDKIRNEETSDSFIFILADYQDQQSQLAAFDKWIADEKLEEYVAYRVPYKVTNPGHPGNGRRLQIVVMQTKNHFQKETIK